MGWALFLLLALVVFAALWRFARMDRAALQFLGAALLLALAGYAWQGRPDLGGSSKPPPERQSLPDSDFAETRRDMLGSFDRAGTYLTIADSYQRRGDTESAAQIIGSGLRQNRRDADLWVGLGNALVLHAGGMMTPAAQLAFSRAEEIAPGHPAPRFFYGLALVQGGRYDEAGRIWRELLQSAPADASWRAMVEERLEMLARERAARQPPGPPPNP
ncbi:tetratricopeptide repeat protein [Allosphingosinicella sp.]|jgi:tetratricopeptide (TPR) repeat protein|uniref:tetratricopeptide repeat protein n=1 Tax=Allosphingosinicella sp. TaxID=2823234 RepID=UPI002F120B4E